jgi:hypothetical protein
MSTHPAAAVAIAALTDLATWTPANAGELARILDAVHDHGQHSIVSALLDVLDNLASASFGLDGLTPDQSRLISGHLVRAGQAIGGAASDWIDRARQELPERSN